MDHVDMGSAGEKTNSGQVEGCTEIQLDRVWNNKKKKTGRVETNQEDQIVTRFGSRESPNLGGHQKQRKKNQVDDGE